MNNLPSPEVNAWNPFFPTPRDIERTEQLAKKNSFVAAFLTFLFLPAAMIYLNRGLNPVKIFGYAIAIGMAVSISTKSSEEKAFEIGQMAGTIANIAIVVENINTINQARKRQNNSVLVES
jgi:hypothetical protein